MSRGLGDVYKRQHTHTHTHTQTLARAHAHTHTQRQSKQQQQTRHTMNRKMSHSKLVNAVLPLSQTVDTHTLHRVCTVRCDSAAHLTSVGIAKYIFYRSYKMFSGICNRIAISQDCACDVCFGVKGKQIAVYFERAWNRASLE